MGQYSQFFQDIFKDNLIEQKPPFKILKTFPKLSDSEGGLDSPSKRAQRFDDLKDYWGGSGGVLATFMHTPRETETYRCLSSTTESDNYLTDLGQTWNELRK